MTIGERDGSAGHSELDRQSKGECQKNDGLQNDHDRAVECRNSAHVSETWRVGGVREGGDTEGERGRVVSIKHLWSPTDA